MNNSEIFTREQKFWRNGPIHYLPISILRVALSPPKARIRAIREISG